MGFGTSGHMMMRALVYLISIALLSVITVCPLLACPMPAATSCCHHSKTPSVPCTESTFDHCPYVLLEKAKAQQGLILAGFALLPAVLAARIHPVQRPAVLAGESYSVDLSGSFHFFRVLRI